MSGALGRWDDQDPDPLPEADPTPDPPVAKPYYGNVAEFVEQYLAPMYRGDTNTWCAQWWKHPEATIRLTALWLAWEQLRLDPALGMSVWLRDHLDHHMSVLLSGDGPLKGCKPKQHREERLSPLATQPPPAGLYVDERTQNP